MASFNLDRFKFTWKGTWNNNVDYRKDDIVYYQGKSYSCLAAHTSSTNFYHHQDPTSRNESFTVTVGIDTFDNQTQGHFYINGVEQAKLTLIKGRQYSFVQNDASNNNFNGSANPILLSTVINGDLNGGAVYNEGVTYFLDNAEVTLTNYLANFSTATLRELRVTLSTTSPKKLYYFSPINKNLGSKLHTEYSSFWELMTDGQMWKGDWSQNTFYPLGALVNNFGDIYRVTKQHTSGTSLYANISNWEFYGQGYKWLGEWSPNNDYETGQVVKYGANIYRCKNFHTSANTIQGLEANITDWTLISTVTNWLDSYTSGYRYHVNDIVRYGGNVYRCITGHTATDIIILANWEVYNSGIEYKGAWTLNTYYKKNDLVKHGSSIFKVSTGHNSSTVVDTASKSTVFVPGLEFDNLWSNSHEYAVGDIVTYGGYEYIATITNSNQKPSNLTHWELLATGYSHQGVWSPTESYKTGDVVQYGGNLYICTSDTTAGVTPEITSKWNLLVRSLNFKGDWNDNTQYYLNDVVIFAGTSYKCIYSHLSTASDSRPDLDAQLTAADYWQVLIQGKSTNVLTTKGDLQTFDTQKQNLSIGGSNKSLGIDNGLPAWVDQDIVSNVFYVSMQGSDTLNTGKTIESPFRTVKHACEYVEANVAIASENSTIYILSGMYSEILPISIPQNCALVGDELRSVVIQPAAGYLTSNMFYVRNGSGIRHLTLQGLTGTLGDANAYLTKRPTAGAFVSLDPGAGPDDVSVHISTRSPYIHNVSAFGTGCVGLKIDGALHNSGNDSILANNFTQILSDGIGCWITNLGRSELVSVYTYYCHIGYLTEGGGKIRALNGNNSYGDFGSVAEGFDSTETPLTATIDNRSKEAQFSDSFSFGPSAQKILAIGLQHCGQNYTSASISFSGSGTNGAGIYDDFRQNAISNVKINMDSNSITGGENYTYRVFVARSGTDSYIDLSLSDQSTSAEIVGQRIVLINGLGVGQYAKIDSYDENTNRAVVKREFDNQTGWDHFQPGWPIETLLDSTSRYVIEPRVTFSEPSFTSTTISPPTGANWKYIVYGENKWVAIQDGTGGTVNVAYSTDTTNWTTTTAVSTSAVNGLIHTGTKFLASHSGSGNVALISDDGQTWSNVTLSATETYSSCTTDNAGKVWILGQSGNITYSTDHGINWTTLTSLATASNGQTWDIIQYGNSIVVALDISTGDLAYSNDNGTNWTVNQNKLTSNDWKDVVFGKDRFVFIGASKCATTFDGYTIQETTNISANVLHVSYGQGLFIASGDDSVVQLSLDGNNWRSADDSTNNYSLSQVSDWQASAFGNNQWIIVNSSANVWNTVNTGARAIARAIVRNKKIAEFALYDCGSGYTSTPTITVTDNNATTVVNTTIFKNNGVLGPPNITNRGQGYVSLSATITGDGFADIFQSGAEIVVNNLASLPKPGSTIVFTGIDKDFLLSKVSNTTGSGPYGAQLRISPTIKLNESLDHGANLLIRERYSQIRLTGHDFLDIGTGSQADTQYPSLYVEGSTILNNRQPDKETFSANTGRVFYTSTDQDGNFRVGELFKVDQATGIVTINTNQFDLGGLTELTLGGVSIGGSAVVIREFSKDASFVADSHNIVPTQKAIKTFLESRISGGGSNTSTNKLVAARITAENNNLDTIDQLPIGMNKVTKLLGGVDGHYLAVQYFDSDSGEM